MGVMRVVERPAMYPGRTLWGRTRGPVVYCGDVIPGDEKIPGVSVYLDERESRELLHAWKWPTPERHAELEARIAELEAEVAGLEAELAEALQNEIRVVRLDEVLASSASTSTARKPRVKKEEAA